VAHDVGALAGKDRASGGRTMEELQPDFTPHILRLVPVV
jgi:hypothetical protein